MAMGSSFCGSCLFGAWAMTVLKTTDHDMPETLAFPRVSNTFSLKDCSLKACRSSAGVDRHADGRARDRQRRRTQSATEQKEKKETRQCEADVVQGQAATTFVCDVCDCSQGSALILSVRHPPGQSSMERWTSSSSKILWNSRKAQAGIFL